MQGPYLWRGYCFYQGMVSTTCDQVCSSVGGSNMIDFALLEYDKPV